MDLVRFASEVGHPKGIARIGGSYLRGCSECELVERCRTSRITTGSGRAVGRGSGVSQKGAISGAQREENWDHIVVKNPILRRFCVYVARERRTSGSPPGTLSTSVRLTLVAIVASPLISHGGA